MYSTRSTVRYIRDFFSAAAEVINVFGDASSAAELMHRIQHPEDYKDQPFKPLRKERTLQMLDLLGNHGMLEEELFRIHFPKKYARRQARAAALTKG